MHVFQWKASGKSALVQYKISMNSVYLKYVMREKKGCNVYCSHVVYLILIVPMTKGINTAYLLLLHLHV